MSSKLQTEAVRSVAGTALTGALANVGVATTSPGVVIAILNGCNDQVIVSWDGGTTDGFSLPPNSAIAIDGPTNSSNENVRPLLPVGAQFQAKHAGSAPTSGTLSITVIT